MANVIQTKRGQLSNIGNAELQDGELAVAFNEDKSEAGLFVGNGDDKVQINLKGEKGDTGAKGDPGANGEKGETGPNEVSAETGTSLVGLLKGNGSNVEQATAGTDFIAPDGTIDGGTF